MNEYEMLDVNRKAPKTLQKRLEWLMQHGATKIRGSINIDMESVASAHIEVDMWLMPKLEEQEEDSDGKDD